MSIFTTFNCLSNQCRKGHFCFFFFLVETTTKLTIYVKQFSMEIQVCNIIIIIVKNWFFQKTKKKNIPCICVLHFMIFDIFRLFVFMLRLRRFLWFFLLPSFKNLNRMNSWHPESRGCSWLLFIMHLKQHAHIINILFFFVFGYII